MIDAGAVGSHIVAFSTHRHHVVVIRCMQSTAGAGRRLSLLTTRARRGLALAITKFVLQGQYFGSEIAFGDAS
jgi:hypothetical protein